MQNLRAFIAIELPSEIRSAIYKATAGLHLAFDRSLVRWVAQHNLHLTLKFLGDVSPSKVELLQQMLLSEAANYQSFDLQVGGLGCFPSPKRPRVIWIGIQAPPGLASLQDSIEFGCRRSRFSARRAKLLPASDHRTHQPARFTGGPAAPCRCTGNDQGRSTWHSAGGSGAALQKRIKIRRPCLYEIILSPTDRSNPYEVTSERTGYCAYNC